VTITLYALLSINIITLIVFGIDKYLALAKRYRISEKNLLLLALTGGSVGALVAQRLFRHKRQKFKYVLWIILSLHLLLGYTLWNLHFR
jgi:uncharacterized membrane protein YsdA (DUF1294 family)